MDFDLYFPKRLLLVYTKNPPKICKHCVFLMSYPHDKSIDGRGAWCQILREKLDYDAIQHGEHSPKCSSSDFLTVLLEIL